VDNFIAAALPAALIIMMAHMRLLSHRAKMQLCEKDIREFEMLYKEIYKQEISREQSTDLIDRLLNLIQVLLKY
jgi:hypothetical protein